LGDIRLVAHKDVAFRRAKEWTAELLKATKYIGTLRKKFEEDLANMVFS